MSVGSWSFVYLPYSRTEVMKYVPKIAGLYALWVNYDGEKWDCFYVGKANNIEKCLLDHLFDDEPNECIKKNVKYGKCAFSWIEITTEHEFSEAEKYLYDKMKPVCIQRDPGGIPLTIPLPPEPGRPQ